MRSYLRLRRAVEIADDYLRYVETFSFFEDVDSRLLERPREEVVHVDSGRPLREVGTIERRSRHAQDSQHVSPLAIGDVAPALNHSSFRSRESSAVAA
jgi:hypothetical protein